MSRWDEVREGEGQGSGQYFPCGLHQVELVRVLDGPSQKKKGVHKYVAEFVVLKSTNPELLPGSSRAWVVLDTWYNWNGQLKDFHLVLEEATGEDILGDLEAIYEDGEKKVKGAVVTVEGIPSDKSDFVKCIFHSADHFDKYAQAATEAVGEAEADDEESGGFDKF